MFSPNGKVVLATCATINAGAQQTLPAKLAVSAGARGTAALGGTQMSPAQGPMHAPSVDFGIRPTLPQFLTLTSDNHIS